MVDHIKVTNKTSRMVTVHSFDGDSCHVPGNAVSLPIESKFDWKMPSEITIETDEVVSQHIMDEKQKPEAISNIGEANKRAAARRNQKNIGMPQRNPTPVEKEPVDHGVSPSTVKGVAVLKN